MGARVKDGLKRAYIDWKNTMPGRNAEEKLIDILIGRLDRLEISDSDLRKEMSAHNKALHEKMDKVILTMGDDRTDIALVKQKVSTHATIITLAVNAILAGGAWIIKSMSSN